jgi:hypothetical protein
MNTPRYISLLFAATVSLLCRSAAAAPPVAGSPAAYRLTLPSADNGKIGPPDSYLITFNLLNASPHKTLYFVWAPYVEPALRFQVDHKAPGDNPNTDSGWKPVKPIPKPAPKPGISDLVVHEEDDRQRVVLTPGQNGSFFGSLGYSLAAPGFYRISLTMTMDAYEKENPSDAQGRQRKLVLQSDHLVVAKTDWGFVSVTERP